MIVDSRRRIATRAFRKALFAMLLIGCLLLPIIGGIELLEFAGVKTALAWAQAPEKTQIVFHSNRDASHEIYVMDADGNNQHRLINNPAADRLPYWFAPGFTTSASPAGKLKSTLGKIKRRLRSR